MATKSPALPIDRRPADSQLAATIREVTRTAKQLFENQVIQALLRGPTSVTFPSATPSVVRVSHGLGRVPLGYLVASIDAGQVVYTHASSFTATDSPSDVIYLATATGGCTAKVYFF